MTSRPQGDRRQSGVSKRAPLWLRVVLMILLILTASIAFYINNQKIIERLNQ